MRFFVLFLLLFTAEAHAQLFTIKVTDYGGIDSSALLKSTLDRELLEFQNSVNDTYL